MQVKLKNNIARIALASAILLVPSLVMAGANCTNTCTRYCGQNYDPESTDYGICFEGCIFGCVNGPEMPTVP